MTRIAVIEEKYGTRYFDVTTKEQLHKVALHLLRERFEDNWYYEPEPVPSLDFAEEDIVKAPVSLQEEMQKRLSVYKHQMRKYQQKKSNWDEIVMAVETNDGELATGILKGRSDYEYESFDIETCEEPD